jgi:hypothetical protein
MKYFVMLIDMGANSTTEFAMSSATKADHAEQFCVDCIPDGFKS